MPETLTCREFIEFLDAYLDNSISSERRSIFEGHLSECRHCRMYLEQYRTTVELARSVGKSAREVVDHTQAPPAVLEAVRRAIQGR